MTTMRNLLNALRRMDAEIDIPEVEKRKEPGKCDAEVEGPEGEMVVCALPDDDHHEHHGYNSAGEAVFWSDR